MAKHPRLPVPRSGALWFAVSALESVAGGLARRTGQGLACTLAAVLVSVRLRRSDGIGLACGLLAAVAYALFETPLRGQWVAVAPLLAWWVGLLASALRYRWRA